MKFLGIKRDEEPDLNFALVTKTFFKFQINKKFSSFTEFLLSVRPPYHMTLQVTVYVKQKHINYVSMNSIQ